jgi:hypothetical protein
LLHLQLPEVLPRLVPLNKGGAGGNRAMPAERSMVASFFAGLDFFSVYNTPPRAVQ